MSDTESKLSAVPDAAGNWDYYERMLDINAIHIALRTGKSRLALREMKIEAKTYRRLMREAQADREKIINDNRLVKEQNHALQQENVEINEEVARLRRELRVYQHTNLRLESLTTENKAQSRVKESTLMLQVEKQKEEIRDLKEKNQYLENDLRVLYRNMTTNRIKRDMFQSVENPVSPWLEQMPWDTMKELEDVREGIRKHPHKTARDWAKSLRDK
eukprot:GEMP01021441.1.p1 GENE.GEMP01021441.1~~GEMP01021441.1.p1  ORF type:complete len:217 (+),score=52.71 GEMP01021441.1:96-746(+)